MSVKRTKPKGKRSILRFIVRLVYKGTTLVNAFLSLRRCMLSPKYAFLHCIFWNILLKYICGSVDNSKSVSSSDGSAFVLFHLLQYSYFIATFPIRWYYQSVCLFCFSVWWVTCIVLFGFSQEHPVRRTL